MRFVKAEIEVIALNVNDIVTESMGGGGNQGGIGDVDYD